MLNPNEFVFSYESGGNYLAIEYLDDLRFYIICFELTKLNINNESNGINK